MGPVTVEDLIDDIYQLVRATLYAVKYLNLVEDAPKDRAVLARETVDVLVPLVDLRFKLEKAEPADPLFTGVCSLRVEGGPLDQFREAMEELVRKLKPEGGMEKFGKELFWTLDEKDTNYFLSKMEQLETHIGPVLRRDHA